MTKYIEVIGVDAIDQDLRKKGLEKLNKLPTDILQKLSELSESEKAQNQLKNNFNFIKTFLG